jgi:hypothetical protein
MNKTKVVIASTLLSGIIFTNLNAQNTPQSLEHKTPNKKEYKNSFGYDVDLIVNGFHGGFVYRKKSPKLTLKIGLHTSLNSHGGNYETQENIHLLTIPDTNNLFIGQQNLYDNRTIKINVGVEKYFAKKEKGSFFYGGDVVLGIQHYSHKAWENEYKIERDTAIFDQITFKNQNTFDKDIEKTTKSYIVGVSGNFGYKYNLFKQLSVITRIELESQIVSSYKNNITTLESYNTTTETLENITTFDFNTNIWLSLNYCF